MGKNIGEHVHVGVVNDYSYTPLIYIYPINEEKVSSKLISRI